MTPEEARRRAGPIDRILRDRTGYDEDTPEGQQRIREAVAVLFEHGTVEEQGAAADFFSRRTMSPVEAALAVRLYAERGWDSGHPAALALARAREIRADDHALLRRLFLAAPERHLEVAKAVLRHQPQGPAWDALAELVRRTDDAKLLRQAFAIASELRRQDDFLALLRGRPETLIGALAAELNEPWMRQALREAGLLGRS